VKIRKTIRDFKEEQECMMPCVDLIPEQVDKLIVDFEKIDLLIVDGLYAINAPDVDMRIFIDLTYHETKINQIIRMKEALTDFRLNILNYEHKAVRSLRPMADYIINKSYELKSFPRRWRMFRLVGGVGSSRLICFCMGYPSRSLSALGIQWKSKTAPSSKETYSSTCLTIP
jgi:hypothetical protein